MHLNRFLNAVKDSILSPFVLLDIVMEAAKYQSNGNPAQISQHIRSPVYNAMLQRCLQL